MNDNQGGSPSDFENLDLTTVYQNSWFKLYLPKSLGGKNWPLPRGLDLLYRFAREDGNLAWVVNLGSGANYFYPMLEPNLAHQVYGGEKSVIAGNGTPTGTLQQLSGGNYRLQGTWPWCTGADWASAFTLTARELDASGRETGTQRSAVLFPSEVQIHREWTAMGLQYSASYTLEVENLELAPERLFRLEEFKKVPDSAFFRFPFLALARLSFAACVAGMARHFCDLGQQFLEEKVRQTGHRLAAPFRQWENSQHQLSAAEQRFFQMVETSWALHLKKKALPATTIALIDTHCFTLTEQALEAADALFPWLGMAAVDTTQPINQVWRDLHTGAQHGLLKRL